MDTAFQNSTVSGRIDVLMSIDPVQTRAFLIGLQSGYTLAKSAQQQTEAGQEKNN